MSIMPETSEPTVGPSSALGDPVDVGTVLYTVLEVLIAIGCCLGNTLVIWAVVSSKSLRQPTFFFIASLAVADLLVGCVAIPIAAAVNGRPRTSFHACLFANCVVLLLIMASVLSLMAIALDRYLRVFMPFRYKRTVTQRRSWLAVAVCWLAAMLLSFTPMFGWNNRGSLSEPSTVDSSAIVCEFVAVIPFSYLVYFSFFLCTLTPLVVMTALYCYIFCAIQRQLREGPGGGQSRTYLQKERRLAGSLALVLALFALGWLPLHVMNCLAYFSKTTNIPSTAFYVGILLSHANSAVNPVVYPFKIKKVKLAYMQIWKRYFSCGEEQQGSQSTSSQTTDNNVSSVVKKD